MVLYVSYIFLPISRKSSNERPFGSGEVECRVAAAIGYGLGALAKSIPQWKTSLANPCNSLHVSHCHSRPLDDVQKYWHTSLQFGNMCANLTGDWTSLPSWWHESSQTQASLSLSLSLSLCAKFCTKACHVTAPARIQPLRTVATAPGTSINKSCDGTPGTAETLWIWKLTSVEALQKPTIWTLDQCCKWVASLFEASAAGDSPRSSATLGSARAVKRAKQILAQGLTTVPDHPKLRESVCQDLNKSSLVHAFWGIRCPTGPKSSSLRPSRYRLAKT